MTETTEVLIPFEDLTRVAFECKKCHTETTMDISTKENRGFVAGQPWRCTICSTDFDSQLKGAINDLMSWYEKVSDSKQCVYFRVKRG